MLKTVSSTLMANWSESVSQVLDKVVAVVIRQKMIPTSMFDLHLNCQYCEVFGNGTNLLQRGALENIFLTHLCFSHESMA